MGSLQPLLSSIKTPISSLTSSSVFRPIEQMRHATAMSNELFIYIAI